MERILNIVNESDEIIGIKTREEIHKEGLLHREIHVYFITSNNELIVQHRAKTKDTYPDLLDATVGGHVEIGDSYEKTVIKETKEETGIDLSIKDLIFISKIRIKGEDKLTGKINDAFLARYLYIFNGDIKDLKIEDKKALGFEAWTYDKLLNLSEEDKNKFIPNVLNFAKNELKDFINC